MKVIGLLGGIGSGKSTVARVFAEQGCVVVDADRIGHELLDVEPWRGRLVEAFGAEIVGGDGRIDRGVLADRAFASAEEVGRLNGILHPAIVRRCLEAVERHRAEGRARAVVLDAPLLVEAGLRGVCDVLVFVACEARKRSERAGDRLEGMKKREKFQISLDSKREIADYTIDNNSGVSAIGEQVARILSAL